MATRFRLRARRRRNRQLDHARIPATNGRYWVRSYTPTDSSHCRRSVPSSHRRRRASTRSRPELPPAASRPPVAPEHRRSARIEPLAQRPGPPPTSLSMLTVEIASPCKATDAATSGNSSLSRVVRRSARSLSSIARRRVRQPASRSARCSVRNAISSGVIAASSPPSVPRVQAFPDLHRVDREAGRLRQTGILAATPQQRNRIRRCCAPPRRITHEFEESADRIGRPRRIGHIPPAEPGQIV